MSYDPLIWNTMYLRTDLKRCPWCSNYPEQQQMGNKERQHRISCGYAHCAIQPRTKADYDLEEVVIDWQMRKPVSSNKGGNR